MDHEKLSRPESQLTATWMSFRESLEKEQPRPIANLGAYLVKLTNFGAAGRCFGPDRCFPTRLAASGSIATSNHAGLASSSQCLLSFNQYISYLLSPDWYIRESILTAKSPNTANLSTNPRTGRIERVSQPQTIPNGYLRVPYTMGGAS